ncbi:transmembrane protein 35B-like [Anguilla anguilla]|uniref:transmembrane protein 35B-like n=1 Tax=Anguilla anguilla TaxID=7936 RepID=UPI0015A8A57B|nr:transmembrane protein 35B-like [Anguilla anguilla]
MALVFTALRVLLGVAFALSGAVKLTDQISEETHAHMSSQFVQFASVFPLRVVGVEVDPVQYLALTGWLELVCGVLLAFGPRLLQEISNLVLSVVMMVAIFTLLKLQEPLYMCCPAAVFLGLLLLLAIRGRGGPGAKSKRQ